MLSCKDLVKTISSEDQASWKRKVEVRFHLMMCKHCSKYAKHLKILKSGIKNLIQTRTQNIEPDHIRKIEDQVIKKLK